MLIKSWNFTATTAHYHLYTDNQAAEHIATQHTMSEHSRSIDIRHHSLRQNYLDNLMRIGGVSSKDNTADRTIQATHRLTLSRPRHQYCCNLNTTKPIRRTHILWCEQHHTRRTCHVHTTHTQHGHTRSLRQPTTTTHPQFTSTPQPSSPRSSSNLDCIPQTNRNPDSHFKRYEISRTTHDKPK